MGVSANCHYAPSVDMEFESPGEGLCEFYIHTYVGLGLGLGKDCVSSHTYVGLGLGLGRDCVSSTYIHM